MPWTEPEAIAYIRSRLGFPKRAVELDKTQIENALRAAMRKIPTAFPKFKFQTFTISEGVQGYDLSATGLNLPYGRGLTRLFDSPITSPQAVFNEFEYYRLRQPPYVDMGELLLDNMYYKEISLLTGTHFDWEWIPSDTKILITPSPTRTRSAAYEYAVEANKLEEVTSSYQDWVIRYALAICKEMLGRVRGKFQGVPGNDLPLNMDHDSLLSEASTELSNLEEELDKLSSHASWTPPLKG